jgi:hypothetical protein
LIHAENILKKILTEKVNILYVKLLKIITSENESKFFAEWRYYNDGKSWLCKVVNKKRTIFWLSVWEGYFKVSFYFTEMHKEGISSLPISESAKSQFITAKPIGKLIPLTIDVYSEEQLEDVLTIAKFRARY